MFFIVFPTCGNRIFAKNMAGGSIARFPNIADIHRLITDVMQLDNDTDRFWFQEELVVANIVGIGLENCTCYHVKKSTFYLEGFFLWHFDDFRCNVWAKCYEMARSTSVFFLCILGHMATDDQDGSTIWTRGHTQASGQD